MIFIEKSVLSNSLVSVTTMSFKAEASIQAEKIRCIIIQCVLTSGLFANRLRCRFYWQQEKVSFRRRRFTHGMFRIFSISSGRSKMTTRLSRSCLYPDRFEEKKEQENPISKMSVLDLIFPFIPNSMS